jgi:hypothetical protein
MSAHSPLSSNASSTILPSPKFAAGISTESTPTRPHTVSTTDKRTHQTSPLSQQSSAPPPRPFPQVAQMPTPVLSHSQALGPYISPTSPLSANSNYSGPQQPPSSSSTDLLHALNHAFQIQSNASQAQNVATQTLTQLVETVLAVAQGQGLDTGIIQNYFATLPMQPPPIQQPLSQNPAPQPVEEHPAPSVSDLSVDKGRASTSTPRSLISSEPSLPPKRKRKSIDLPPPPIKKASPNAPREPAPPSSPANKGRVLREKRSAHPGICPD